MLPAPGELWAARYSAWHARALGDTKQPPRFVVLDCKGGRELGSQANAFVSTALLAMLTQRVLLLGEGCSALDAFRQPFSWRRRPAVEQLSSIHLLDVTAPNPELRCGDYSSGDIGTKRVLRVRSSGLYAEMILQNAHLEQVLIASFPNGDVFGTLFRTLLKPSKAVTEAAHSFNIRHFRGHYVTGLDWHTTNAPSDVVEVRVAVQHDFMSRVRHFLLILCRLCTSTSYPFLDWCCLLRPPLSKRLPRASPSP